MEDNSIKISKNRILKERDVYLSQSNIPKEYLKYKWKKVQEGDKFYDPNFKGSTLGAIGVSRQITFSRKNARDNALDYARNIKKYSELGRSLCFIGGKDSGKTVLATLILREAINKFIGSVLFVPFSQFCIEGSVWDNDDVNDFISKYTTPDILCIDDVDEQENVYGKFKTYFSHILNERKSNQDPTIITSKISLDKMGEVCGKSVVNIITDNNTYKILSIMSSEGQISDIDYQCSGFNFRLEDLIKDLNAYKDRKGDSKIIKYRDLQKILYDNKVISYPKK